MSEETTTFSCQECGYEGVPRGRPWGGTRCPVCASAKQSEIAKAQVASLAHAPEYETPADPAAPLPTPDTRGEPEADDYEEVMVEESGTYVAKRLPKAQAEAILKAYITEPQDQYWFDPTEIGHEYYEGARAALAYRWTDRKLLAHEYRKAGFLPVKDALNRRVVVRDGAEGKMVSMPGDPNTVLVATPQARAEGYRQECLSRTLEMTQLGAEELESAATEFGNRSGVYGAGREEDTEYRRQHGGGDATPTLANMALLQAQAVEHQQRQRAMRGLTGPRYHSVPDLPWKKGR